MEFKEISIPEGISQQISHEGQFAKINMERARYLLSTDEMLEEMLNKTHG